MLLPECFDCGLPYGCNKWADIVLSNGIWKAIEPPNGLLCFNCIVGRINELGLEQVKIKITSGPLEFIENNYDHLGPLKNGFPSRKTETMLRQIKDIIDKGGF